MSTIEGKNLSYLWKASDLLERRSQREPQKRDKKAEQGEYARGVKRCSCGKLVFSAGTFGQNIWYDAKLGYKFVKHVCKK